MSAGRIGFNGGGPPDGAPPARGGSVADRLGRLEETIGAFPDPLNGHGGSGICLYLHDLKRERVEAKAAESGVAVFVRSWQGRITIAAATLTFLGGALAGAAHFAATMHWIK